MFVYLNGFVWYHVLLLLQKTTKLFHSLSIYIRFANLRSLNLADNDLTTFPLAVCRMRTLTELNLASNKIEDVPPTIADLEKYTL